MKRTYTLPGVFWDHRPETDVLPPLDAHDIAVPEAGTPYCLFDVNGTRRIIRLTTLLNVKDRSEMETIVAKLAECDTVYVTMDYQPEADGSIQRAFYRKRVRQAIALLNDALPDARIAFMEPPEWERTA